MTISDLESYFTDNPPEKEIQIDNAILILDTAKFIETNIMRMKMWDKEIEKCPSYWHLMQLYNKVATPPQI